MSIRNRILKSVSTLINSIQTSKGEVILGKSNAGAGFAQEIPIASMNALIGAETAGAAAAAQAHAIQRANHTGTQAHTTITGLGNAATANIGTTEGLIPVLGAGGKLASSLLPSIALTETLSVANAAARLALTSAQAQGKIVSEADTGKSYGLVSAGNPATSGDWLQLGDRDITAADIVDSTAAGRALLLAANAAAQIAALGAETPAGAQAKADAAQAAAIAASARAIETKTANFTAVVGGRYITESGGTISITDPTGTVAGQSYEVWIGSGQIWFNGAGTVYSASLFSVRRRYNGSAWVIPAATITDTLTVGSGTWNGLIFTAPQAFSSTTRPTSAGTGTPADNSLITALDRRTLEIENTTNVYVRQQMGWEAGPWVTVGASGAYTLDGNSAAGGRFIGTTALASASAQGGGVKYPDGGITGGTMTSLSRTWQMRYLFNNPLGAASIASAFFMGLRNSIDFWSSSSIGLYHVPQPPNSWAAATVYSLGDRINVGGIVYICSTAGTTGGSQPTWGTALNGTTTDNTATWRHLGPHTSNNWALGIVSAAGAITLTNTGVAWVSGTSNNTLLYLRSDGTNIYASINGSSEVSVARGALTSATPYIMCRGDAGGTSANRIVGKLFTFGNTTQ